MGLNGNSIPPQEPPLQILIGLAQNGRPTVSCTHPLPVYTIIGILEATIHDMNEAHKKQGQPSPIVQAKGSLSGL